MMKQLPPDDVDVNQMMAVFDKMERNTGTAKDEMIMAVNSFATRAQNIIRNSVWILPDSSAGSI